MKIMIIIFEIIGLILINYSESRVIKRSPQFYIDDSTSVRQQIGPDTAFNNALLWLMHDHVNCQQTKRIKSKIGINLVKTLLA